MKTQPISFTVILLASTLGLFLGGCCADMYAGPSRAYCDDSGCYKCGPESNCWPIPNQRCTKDKDCPTGDKCTNIGCAKPCKKNSDCGGENVCTGGYCAPPGFNNVKPVAPPVKCTKDSQCTPESYCKSGTCAPRCKSDDQCSPGTVCAPCGKCQPKGVPATCGAVPNYCSASVKCNTGKTCIKGRCHFTCTSSKTCPVGQTCSGGACKDDPDPGATRQCSLDLHCQNGVCINGYCHACCNNSSECGTKELCLMGICQPDYYPTK